MDVLTSAAVLDARIPDSTPTLSIATYATNRIKGIRIIIIASRIEAEEYFNLDWILRATGRTPYASIAPNITMFKTGNMKNTIILKECN